MPLEQPYCKIFISGDKTSVNNAVALDLVID